MTALFQDILVYCLEDLLRMQSRLGSHSQSALKSGGEGDPIQAQPDTEEHCKSLTGGHNVL